MNPKTRLLLVLLIGFLALVLFVAGMILLPDTLIMQIQADGSAGTTLPKLLGLLLPLALTGVFAVFYYKNGATKHLLVAILGLALFVLTFFFNR